MLTHSRHIRFKLRAALQNVVHLALTAFPADLPVWSSENLIGLPPFQGLLTGLNQHPSEPLGSEALPADAELLLPETRMIDGESRIAEPKRVILSVVADRGLVGYPTVEEMRERYRLASRQSMPRSKKAQN